MQFVNVIIVGLLPGPSEPSKHINTYLSSIVSELISLWDGISFRTHDCGNQVIHCALLCVGCDLPAGRKTCGFLSYTDNLGCSRCYCNFGTGVFGKRNYSGFEHANWIMRTSQKHRDDVKETLTCTSSSSRERKESEFGCRYSCLPYFDAVRMLVIDPMHNLYMGTAKYIFHSVWLKKGIIKLENVKVINEKVQSWIIPPEVQFCRLPPTLEYSSSFTAEQWMHCTKYFPLNILNAGDTVLASRLLCKGIILSEDDLKLADALLLRFCTVLNVSMDLN